MRTLKSEERVVLVYRVARKFGQIWAVYFFESPNRRCYILHNGEVNPDEMLIVRFVGYGPLREASSQERVFEIVDGDD